MWSEAVISQWERPVHIAQCVPQVHRDIAIVASGSDSAI